MKKLLLIIFCTGFLFCYSQSGSQNKGTKPLPNTNQLSSKGQNTTNVVQSLTYPLKHDTCLDKKFSIVFYVIQDSVLPVPGVGVATQQTLNALMTNINNVFKRICVSFTSCSTVLIPNYQYNQWKKILPIPLLRPTGTLTKP